MMSPLLLLSLFFFVCAAPCLAYVSLNINSSTLLQFSSLAWEPTSQQFVAGSAQGPSVYGIPDSGMVTCLFTEPPSNSSSVSVAGIAVDHYRHRLIVAFSNPSSIAAYYLQSYRKIYELPLPELGGAPGGITVDSDSGDVLISGAARWIVLKVGPNGDRKTVVSESNISDDQGLGGIVYLSHGHILAVEPIPGKIFKVDTVVGEVKEVTNEDSSKPMAPSGHAIALQSKSSLVIAADHSLFGINSDHGLFTHTWVHAFGFSYDMQQGEEAVAVAMREGDNVYVLIKSETGYRIEQVPWGGHMKGYVKAFIALYLIVGCLVFWFIAELGVKRSLERQLVCGTDGMIIKIDAPPK